MVGRQVLPDAGRAGDGEGPDKSTWQRLKRCARFGHLVSCLLPIITLERHLEDLLDCFQSSQSGRSASRCSASLAGTRTRSAPSRPLAAIQVLSLSTPRSNEPFRPLHLRYHSPDQLDPRRRVLSALTRAPTRRRAFPRHRPRATPAGLAPRRSRSPPGWVDDKLERWRSLEVKAFRGCVPVFKLVERAIRGWTKS